MTSLPARVAKLVVYRRWQRLKQDTSGMLSPAVYRHLYRRVLDLPDGHGDIVEVGAASGAASIAIAQALQEAGSMANIISIEKAEGGSRARYGDREANIHILENNLELYGVRDRISLYTHRLTLDDAERILEMVSTEQIGGLIIDADGHLHRDFTIFWPHLASDALIMIDDCSPTGSKKHRLTFALVSYLREIGLITKGYAVRQTLFCEPGNGSIESLDYERCQRLVENAKRGLSL